MSLLYIYDGIKDLYVDSDDIIYYYTLNTGKINGKEVNSLNDGLRFNQISLELRDVYTEYINSLNKLFIENRSIYDKNLSLFFLSDLSNKRTELFDTYRSICQINIIKEKISFIKNIDSIVLYGCSHSFARAISSVLPNYNIIWEKVNKKETKPINNLLHQLLFSCKTLFQIILLKLLPSNKRNGKEKIDMFLTHYPLHSGRNFMDEVYGNLVESKDYYLISVITDGMNQNLSIGQFIATLWKIYNSDRKVMILDRYIRFKDIIKFLSNVLRFQKNYKKLFNKNYFFNGIDITEFIRIELAISFLRIPRLILYEFALKFVFSRYDISNFYYYLHEYTYGRYFNYILAKYFPNIERVGFQHGPAAKRKLLYYLGNNVISNSPNDWLYKMPIPNTTLAEDELSKEVYEEAGYNNVKIMKKVYRLEYLKKIKRNKIINNLVLIVPGLHDGLSLLDKLRSYIISNPQKKFIFKPHPRSGHFKNGIPEKYNFVNMFIGNEHVSEYLAKVAEVIVTYSSVGSEAYLLGIQTNLVCLPNKINESPLLDIYEYKSDNLINIIW